MAVRVTWSRTAGVLVASVSGRVDSVSSTAFHTALEEGVGEDDRTLLFDFRHLAYLSSAGLRVLLAMARKYQGPNRGIGACHLSEAVRAVFVTSGFDKIIPVHATRTEALSALSGAPGTDRVLGGEAEAGDSPDAGGTPITMRRAVDLNVVGENIADIALFTVEKHEFGNEDLPPDVRAEAISAIEDVLWQEVKVWQERRKEILAGMFLSAAATLENVLKQKT